MNRLTPWILVALIACTPTAAPASASPTAVVSAPPPSSATLPAAASAASQTPRATGPVTLREFPVPPGSGPHDVAPAADGGVWYTAQRSGKLGYLDPKTGQTKEIPLGAGSAPHGVIVGPDGAPWITDSGLNAILRVDPTTLQVRQYAPLRKPDVRVDLNTAAFDKDGVLWWTGQNGWFGNVIGGAGFNIGIGAFEAPRGRGPYGITATPGGEVYFASLAGNYVGRVDKSTGSVTVLEPPTQGQGARRVWSDSKGVIWVSEWNAGQLGRFDPATSQWKEWKLPGSRPQAYAVFVDDRDVVWLSEWSASAIVRFDPATERFDVFPHAPNGNVRQIHGRPGEVWGALSALDKLLLVTTR